MSSPPPPNSLGLDFEQLQIQPPIDTATSQRDLIQSPDIALDDHLRPAQPPSKEDSTLDANTTDPDKKKPYVNPERVKTGGNQRDKLSEEALTERMLRMREQNEKIKQRRLDVKADEDAFKKTQESERARLAQSRKVQENVDRTREQNAKRKMDKIQSREWDSGKPAVDWKLQAKKPQIAQNTPTDSDGKDMVNVAEPGLSPQESGNWVRGSGFRVSSQRSGGRGRGRGGSNPGQGGIKQRTERSPGSDVGTTPSTSTRPASSETPKETTS